MKSTKIIALIIAAYLLCMLAACGPAGDISDMTSEPESAAAEADISSFITIGQVLALDGKEEEQSSMNTEKYVCAFRMGDVYWRFTAAITPEQSEAIFALDNDDPEAEAKENAILSTLEITGCDNLNEQMLSESDLAALAGKTGEELVNDGWTEGYGYNLEDMTFYLEYGPFTYAVTFESDRQYENTDDFDVIATISTLKVSSAEFLGLGDEATNPWA